MDSSEWAEVLSFITLAVVLFIVLVQIATVITEYFVAKASTGENLLEPAQVRSDAPQQTAETPQSVEAAPAQPPSTPPVTYDAMVASPLIPLVMRVCLPFLALLNIALFVASMLSTGATVVIIISGSVDTDEFSVRSTVQKLFEYEIYLLAILVLCFSMIWPYVKLIIMLATFCLPIRRLSQKRRGTLLHALDILGKWSLLDAFILYLMIAAFSSDVTLLGVTIIEFYVLPEWGFYAFLIATIVSQLLSHTMLYYHRKSSVNDPNNIFTDDVLAADTDGRQPLHRYHNSWTKFVSSSVLTNAMTFAIIASILISFGILFVGYWLLSIQITFEGALGEAIQLTGASASTDYSVITLGLTLPFATDDPTSFGAFFIIATFFLFIVAVPLALLAVLLILWLVDMSLTAQRRVYLIAEVLDAWGCAEVFIVAIGAVILEITAISELVVDDDSCEAIETALTAIGVSDASCFEIGASVLSTGWILIAGACFNLLTTIFALRLAKESLVSRLRHDVVRDEPVKPTLPDVAHHEAAQPTAPEAPATGTPITV